MSQLHRLLDLGMGKAVGRTLVEGHGDIHAHACLDLHRFLGAEEVGAAIQVAAELDPLLPDLADRRQRKELEPARVREDGPVPSLETMHPSEPLEQVDAGAKHQVIGIVEDDPGAGRDVIAETVAHIRAQLFELVGRQRLDRAECADRHEHRGVDDAVPGLDPSSPGSSVDAEKLKRDARRCQWGLTDQPLLQLHLLDSHAWWQVEREPALRDRLVDLDLREFAPGNIAIPLGVLELRRQVGLLVDPDPDVSEPLGYDARLWRQVEYEEGVGGVIGKREVEVLAQLVDGAARSHVLEDAILKAGDVEGFGLIQVRIVGREQAIRDQHLNTLGSVVDPKYVVWLRENEGARRDFRLREERQLLLLPKVGLNRVGLLLLLLYFPDDRLE